MTGAAAPGPEHHPVASPQRAPARPLRVVLADDNPLVRAGLENLLGTCPDIEVVGVAADGAGATELALRLTPDVVLLDVRMPGVDGLSAAAGLHPSAAVLMLTHSDDPSVVGAALRAGARGFLVHTEIDGDELVTAIRTVARGGTYLSSSAGAAVAAALARGAALPAGGSGPAAVPDRARAGPPGGGHDLSPREAEVMDLIATGLTNRQVARRFFLSEKTVKNHVNRIFAKLGVSSRAEAVSRWLGPPGR